MSLVPRDDDDRSLPSIVERGIALLDSTVDWLFRLYDMLVFYGHTISYYRDYIAPVVLKYALLKLGYVGIDQLPFVSWESKEEIKRWLRGFIKKRSN